MNYFVIRPLLILLFLCTSIGGIVFVTYANFNKKRDELDIAASTSKDPLVKILIPVAKLERARKYQEAIDLVNKDLASTPDVPELYASRADSEASSGQKDAAYTDIEKTLSFPNLKWRSFAICAHATNTMKDWKKTIELIDRSAAIKPPGFAQLALRGGAYNSLGKYDEALADYTSAIKIKPELGYQYTLRAGVYDKLGNAEAAGKDRAEADRLKTSGQ